MLNIDGVKYARCILALVLLMPLCTTTHALKDDVNLLPVLSLTSNQSTSNDGHIDLSWEPSPKVGAYDYAQITLTSSSGSDVHTATHWVEGESATLQHYMAGMVTVEIRACRLDVQIEVCSDAANSQVIEVAADAIDSLPLAGQPTELLRNSGGPTSYAPGLYQSSLALNNGWLLYWKNDLARPTSDPLYGNRNQLVIVWNTFENMAAAGQSANLQPVWLTGVLSDLGQTGIYRGSLIKKTRSAGGQVTDALVGELRVSMRTEGGRQLPTVEWYLPNPRYYRNGSPRWVSDPLLWTPDIVGVTAAPNPVDHYQGLWLPPPGSSFDQQVGFASTIVAATETQSVLFFDNAGQPIWAVGFRDGRPSNPATAVMTEWCVWTAIGGDYPDTPDQDGVGATQVALGCNPGSGPTTVGNFGRAFRPLQPGSEQQSDFWVQIQLPASMGRTGGVIAGHEFGPVEMLKVAHRHGVTPLIVGDESGSQCVRGVGGLCQLTMNWFTDGVYPDARVFRRNLNSNALQWVANGWPVVQGFNHSIGVDGEYRFELWRDGDTSANGQVLALSHTLNVIERLPPQAIAGNVDYQYDALGRLSEVRYADGRRIRYAYDKAGNRQVVTIDE